MSASAQVRRATTAQPVLGTAARFLTLLDEAAETFTFQTFDDAGTERRLSRILHGQLDERAKEMTQLNAQGAGVFVMVNCGDGRGRTAANVTSVRALFADFDGTPLAAYWPLEPHFITESSPGRFHAYWVASGIELAEFSPLQKALAVRLGTDPGVYDLPRVMRLPGFYHRKGVPFQTRIIAEQPGPPYGRMELMRAFCQRQPNFPRFGNSIFPTRLRTVVFV